MKDCFGLDFIAQKAMRLPGAEMLRNEKGTMISFVVPKTTKLSKGKFYPSPETAAKRALSRWERLRKKKK